MKPISVAKLASTGVLLMISTTQGQTHPIAAPLSAYEIVLAFEGKTCTSKAGATFTFGSDRHYAYDGLWRNGGHYRIEDGAIVVSFDSGLERAFNVSRKRGVLHMETTPLSCDTKFAKGRVWSADDESWRIGVLPAGIAAAVKPGYARD